MKLLTLQECFPPEHSKQLLERVEPPSRTTFRCLTSALFEYAEKHLGISHNAELSSCSYKTLKKPEKSCE